jgi:hypothetical protein
MSQIVTALREVIAERERLQAELAAMRETADATVAANINLAGERDLARQQVDELMAEREVAAQAAKERAAAFDALQNRSAKLEAINADLHTQVADGNQQIATLQLERDRLQAEINGLHTDLKDAQALAETIRQESRAEIKAVEDKAKAELEATVATALDDMEKAQTIEKDLKAELLALTADREQTLTFLRTVQDDVLAKASEIEALKQEVTEAAVMAANAARSNEEAQTALIARSNQQVTVLQLEQEARAQAESEVAALKAHLQAVQDNHTNTVEAWGNDTRQLTEQLQTAKANYEGWMIQKEQSIQQLQNSLALLRGEQGQMAELLGVQIGAPAQ